MDDVDWHIAAFRARATWPASSKLDALTDLEQLADPRIILFLVHVLSDQREPMEVRIHVLKQLRTGRLHAAQRQSVAGAILRVVNSDRANPELQLQAALALAQFTDIDGVVTTLGGLALDPEDRIDVRYSAFTSLQRAGPTTESVGLLRQLSADELLGPSARSVLSSWHLE